MTFLAAAREVRDTPGNFANCRSLVRRRCETCIMTRGPCTQNSALSNSLGGYKVLEMDIRLVEYLRQCRFDGFSDLSSAFVYNGW
ncbi:hypothetical protein NPIL_598561 [Nephila pilipes]|uniref:Uncharacterized protein n=1 Tax=Nephila pilipes TaxID=299642 RepID=A0A8X6QEZ3_NEPPI|nr:hypothetical protein NPIL_598561 [Nephila pilipes]